MKTLLVMLFVNTGAQYAYMFETMEACLIQKERMEQETARYRNVVLMCEREDTSPYSGVVQIIPKVEEQDIE